MADKEVMTESEFCEAIGALGSGPGWTFFFEQAEGNHEAARHLRDQDRRDRWEKAVAIIGANKHLRAMKRDLSRDVYLRGGWTTAEIYALFDDGLTDTATKMNQCIAQINAAASRREELVRQMKREGMSTGTIAKEARLSSAAVTRILKEADPA